MNLLIAGCGYLGTTLGASLVAAGHHVTGLRRQSAALPTLRAAGITPWIGDFTDPHTFHNLPSESPWDAVVLCGTPDDASEAAYRTVFLDGTLRLQEALAHHPPRTLVFVSSTSVYGQTDGSWVTEDSPTQPASPTARLLLQAEQLVLSPSSPFPGRVVRPCGIYGPHRHRLHAWRRGDARPTGDGSRWMNLIHRDDLASALVAVLENGQDHLIYNVADGSPVTELDFFHHLSQTYGPCPTSSLPLPPSSPTGSRSRRSTNKRVDATRLRRDLHWQPLYPDFRAGYAHGLNDAFPPHL